MENMRQYAESEMNSNKHVTTSPECDESGAAVRDQDLNYANLQVLMIMTSQLVLLGETAVYQVHNYTVGIAQDDMPPQYRHVREGVRKVKSDTLRIL